MYEAPWTMFLFLGPVLKLLSGLLAIGGAVIWNGLENEFKDKINLNSFKFALTLSWTRDCFEGVGWLIFVYLILG